MAFDPPEADFVQLFDKILTDIQTICSDIVRVITHLQFNQYTQLLSSETGLRFQEIVSALEIPKLPKIELQINFLKILRNLRRKL